MRRMYDAENFFEKVVQNGDTTEIDGNVKINGNRNRQFYSFTVRISENDWVNEEYEIALPTGAYIHKIQLHAERSNKYADLYPIMSLLTGEFFYVSGDPQVKCGNLDTPLFDEEVLIAGYSLSPDSENYLVLSAYHELDLAVSIFYEVANGTLMEY